MVADEQKRRNRGFQGWEKTTKCDSGEGCNEQERMEVRPEDDE